MTLSRRRDPTTNSRPLLLHMYRSFLTRLKSPWFALGFFCFLLVLLVTIPILVVCTVSDSWRSLNIMREFQLSRYSLPEAEAECLSKPRSPLIVSFTTTPRRLGTVDRTLTSLLLQTHCPKHIWLWVPPFSSRFEEKYSIPDSLLAFNRSSTIFSILTAIKDEGPATKFLPSLLKLASEQNMDQGVVVLDDDIQYSENMVTQYECYGEVYPRHAMGMWGSKVDETAPIHQGDATFQSQYLSAPMPADILYGTDSYLIRPSFFDLRHLAAYNLSELLNTLRSSSALNDNGNSNTYSISRLQKAAFYEDDLWLALNLFLSGTSSMVIPIRPKNTRPLDTYVFFRGALYHSVNADQSNLQILRNILYQLKRARSAGQATRQRSPTEPSPSPTLFSNGKCVVPPP